MIVSMTGFGLAEVEQAGLVVRAEVRSVNHRFLQVRPRLPAEFGDLEPGLDALLKKRLSRGSVTATLSVSRATSSENVHFDGALAARYRELLGRAARELCLEDDLTLSGLIQLPGVIGTRADEAQHERESKVVLRACKQAVERLVESRGVEGAALDKDLRKHAAAITRLVARIEKRIPRVVAAHQQNLTRRLGELLGDPGRVSPADLAREVALIADRHDVSEEVSRLRSHLEQLDAVLDKGGACGRQLDFLVQELLREANTIGSKCSDAQAAHTVVELKTHIERVREQVQNVE